MDRFSPQINLVTDGVEVHPANALLCPAMGAAPGRGQVLVAPGLVVVFTGQTGSLGHLYTQT